MPKFLYFFAVLSLSVSGVAQAQAIKNEPPMQQFSAEEMDAVRMPELMFEAAPEDVKDYEKYFYFHRNGNSFDEAFADVTECDALTSGLSYYQDSSSAVSSSMMQYGVLGGALGGVLGSAIGDAIFGSAMRRKQRRTNLRNCMYFKGYDRYGLERELWQDFNFEEGNSRENPEDRARALLMQAKVASGPAPQQGRLKP